MLGQPMTSATGFVRHFVACNRHDAERFVRLMIGGKRYGSVTHDIAALLLREQDLFKTEGEGIALNPRFDSFATRSDALLKATKTIAAHYGKPLRGELYGVMQNWGDDPVAQIDRAAVPWFGIRAWGVHVNGFVRKQNGIHLWIGQRAADRPADPGKLDNLIGGGQPIGLSLEENLCKEAKEEAGIEAGLALTARLAPEINYRMERQDGLRTDTLFIYDLELADGFEPRNTDGEVAAFHLLPLPEVAAIIRDTDKFKFNCTLVIIDFMLRRGFLAEADAEYAELKNWLTR
jgi:8-oxo-dGTP pyrophosphatase MutT (NUDIX family)